MLETKISRGRSQIMFNHLTNAVFPQDEYWFKVQELDVKEIEGEKAHLLDYVYNYIENWTANNDLEHNLYPKIPDMYFFGEIQKASFELYPLIFYCNYCKNVHPYRSIEELTRTNMLMKCQFCGKGKLKQYPYVLIHNNGDIQQIVVKTNAEGTNWKTKYDGIRMVDTRSFKTATWFNSKKRYHMGELGTKITGLPITRTMRANNKRVMSGTHISDGSVYYPILCSFVNLKREELMKRKEQEGFPFIQCAALLRLESIDYDNFANNFEAKEQGVLKQLISQLKNGGNNEILRAMIIQMAEINGVNLKAIENDVQEEVNLLFRGNTPIDKIIQDQLLHEFVYSWYECKGETLESKMEEAKELGDATQETVYKEAIKNIRKYGLQAAMLLEEFPVLTMGIGFVRRRNDRVASILNTFKQKIDGKSRIVIPLLSNKNEAIIFKLDPQKVLAWLIINKFFENDGTTYKTEEQAHAVIYEYLLFTEIDENDLINKQPEDLQNDLPQLATIMTFRLLHSYIHGLFQAGKAILGLDIDSISEYLFHSSLSGAIYVSKLQGGGMGALISAFENDLTRWMNALYEKVNTCLYDPVCHQHTGACHACMFLKFSCRYFNHGLTRNLLVGGVVRDYDENKKLVGYLDPKVNELVERWRNS